MRTNLPTRTLFLLRRHVRELRPYRGHRRGNVYRHVGTRKPLGIACIPHRDHCGNRYPRSAYVPSRPGNLDQYVYSVRSRCFAFGWGFGIGDWGLARYAHCDRLRLSGKICQLPAIGSRIHYLTRLVIK